jgi:hypothetical protein
MPAGKELPTQMNALRYGRKTKKVCQHEARDPEAVGKRKTSALCRYGTRREGGQPRRYRRGMNAQKGESLTCLPERSPLTDMMRRRTSGGVGYMLDKRGMAMRWVGGEDRDRQRKSGGESEMVVSP